MADSSRIEDLRRRVQKDPASIAFAQLAEECRRAGDLDEAVSVSRAGLALHPTYLSARVTLGRALLELNQLSEAQTELQYVLRSAPENLAALRALAETLHRQGDLSNSLAQYRVALSLAKNDPDLQETVASLEHQLEAVAMVSQPAAAPERAAAPPEDIFAFLRSDAPASTGAVEADAALAESAVVESVSAFDPPAAEMSTVVESLAFEAPLVVDSPAVEGHTVIETPAIEALSIIETPVVEALSVIERPIVEALTVVEAPGIEALTVVEPPIVELSTFEAPTVVAPPVFEAPADAVVEGPIIEHHAIDVHVAEAPSYEAFETLDPATTGDLDRVWAEPVPSQAGQSHEATTEPEPQIQWPLAPEPDDDFFFAAPPVAPGPEPVVPAAYHLTRERDARTVVVLEQWLQAVHVSRTQRHA
jgi:Tetratricopeptide repeat